MKLHEKKLYIDYAEAKCKGEKPFEIRLNDCDYQVGDLVHYTVVGLSNAEKRTAQSIKEEVIKEFFKNAVYQITYITDYEQKDGYIVYGEKRIN